MLEEDLISNIPSKEKLIRNSLKHPAILEVRSKGLMIAVEFESYELLKAIIDQAIEMGIITDWFLFNNRSMRIAPPLTITEEEIETTCRIILDAIEKVTSNHL